MAMSGKIILARIKVERRLGRAEADLGRDEQGFVNLEVYAMVRTIVL